MLFRSKEFMEIFHEVEGINPDDKKEKSEDRIAMNPVSLEKTEETEKTEEAEKIEES